MPVPFDARLVSRPMAPDAKIALRLQRFANAVAGR
jgi:hypothetical protein